MSSLLRNETTAMNAPVGHLGETKPQGRAALGSSVPPIVRLEGVSKTYAGRQGEPVTALNGIDLTVPQGSVLGVIGRSGAGKSTLIRLVNGLEKPTSGRVIVDGSDITALPESALRQARRSIGMIFQHFNLLSSRTAAQNIALPLEVAGYDKAAIQTRVEELLALVGLSDEKNRYPSELSGGQKQRVGIARALALNPSVLLADEITSGLDPRTTESILQLLTSIRDELDLAVILVTHEMSVVRAFADSVVMLEDGHVVDRGRTGTLLRDVTSHAGAQLHGLREAPGEPDGRVVEVLYTSDGVPADWLTRLSGRLDTEIALLEASIERVGGGTFGRARIRVADPAKHDAVLAALPTFDLVPVTPQTHG
jgi:D-methionine transport system ATP-binding protein